MDISESIENDEINEDLSEQFQAPEVPVKGAKTSRAKPKVTMKWTVEQIHKLIANVQDHECLWNYSLKEHKDLNQREKAWEIIGVELGGVCADQLKAKWTSVSTQYRNHKKKLNDEKSGQGAKQPVYWEFWSEMQFMNKHEAISNTVTDSNLSFSVFAASQLEEIESEETVAGNLNATSTSSIPQPLPATASGIAQRKRKVCTPTPSGNKEMLMQRAISVLEKKDDEDEWQIFGDYIASEMRRMSITSTDFANVTKRKIARHMLSAWDDIDVALSVQTQPIQYASNVELCYDDNSLSQVILVDHADRQLTDVIEKPMNTTATTDGVIDAQSAPDNQAAESEIENEPAAVTTRSKKAKKMK